MYRSAQFRDARKHSKSHPLEKFLSLLILVNVLLTMGAVFPLLQAIQQCFYCRIFKKNNAGNSTGDMEIEYRLRNGNK